MIFSSGRTCIKFRGAQILLRFGSVRSVELVSIETLPLHPKADMERTFGHRRLGRVGDGRGSLGHSATLRFPSPLSRLGSRRGSGFETDEASLLSRLVTAAARNSKAHANSRYFKSEVSARPGAAGLGSSQSRLRIGGAATAKTWRRIRRGMNRSSLTRKLKVNPTPSTRTPSRNE
jgi:hypothetical protein